MRRHLLLRSSPDDQSALEKIAVSLSECSLLDLSYVESKQASRWTVSHLWLSLVSQDAVTLVDDHAIQARHLVIEADDADHLSALAADLSDRLDAIPAAEAVSSARELLSEAPGHLLRAALVAKNEETVRAELADIIGMGMRHESPEVRAVSIQAGVVAGILPSLDILTDMRAHETEPEVQRLLDFVIAQQQP